MKVPFGLDKQAWHPSPLPGQIVLVSTVDASGRANVATKSWVSMVAFGGPVVGFGCNVSHTTYRNTKETGCFVINVPPAWEAERAWALADVHGEERLRASGLTLEPAQLVAAPLVAECLAHFECELDDVRYYGDEVFILGRIVSASIDSDCLAGSPEGRYTRLQPIFFLEEGTYAPLDAARHVKQDVAIPLYLVEMTAPLSSADVDAHVRYLDELARSGRLALAGPFDGDDGGPSGIYVLRAGSASEADAIVRSDPLVASGASYVIRSWVRTH